MLIELTIDRFEGDKAVLKTKDHEEAWWPKNKLPEGAAEGAVLMFTVNDDKNKTGDTRQLAKDILNELLNPEDGK